MIVVNKEKRRVLDTPLNYGIAVGATISEYLSVHPALNLTVDKKFTNPDQEKEFLRIAQLTVQILAPVNKNLVINKPSDSKEESLLQLADFVAGSMNYKYNNKEPRYADIIEDKVVVEKIVKWTQLKKRIVNP